MQRNGGWAHRIYSLIIVHEIGFSSIEFDNYALFCFRMMQSFIY